MQRQIHIDDYLSIRRIVRISLAITIAFYLLYTLTYFFGRPSMAEPERAKEGPQTELQMGVETPSEVGVNPISPGEDNSRRVEGEKKRMMPRMMVILLLNLPLTFLFVFVVLLYCRKVMSKQYALFRDELIINIFGSVFIALLMSALITILQTIIWPNPPGPPRTMFHHVSRGWLSDLPLMAIAIMTCYLLRSLYQERMMDVENETLRAENISSRYEALKNQLDPHFLFNSMNTLQSLIAVDTDRAEEYVQQLCSVLRYTLQKQEVVTLEEEMKCTADYCRMLKIRYGDNLIFDHHINHERYDNFLVPPLAIQGLVENAIKHNVISSKQPLTVHISTDDDGHLIVSNKIQPKVMEEESSGIGLANLSERYRLQWDKNVEIFDDGNNFIVTLPLVEN